MPVKRRIESTELDSPKSETEMHWLVGDDIRANIGQEGVDGICNIV